MRKGLKKDMPEVHAFFSNFKWDSPAQLQMVMAWNQEGGSPEENAKRFLADHLEMCTEIENKVRMAYGMAPVDMPKAADEKPAQEKA